MRVDKFSVQKSRESHDIIQRLTSQLQPMQEQMNTMNDSGEFHEVESNYSGNLSHVPSQPAGIPSPRSMQSCDKRLPPDTWNPSGSRSLLSCDKSLQTEIRVRRSSHCKHLIKEYIPFMAQNAASEAPALISTTPMPISPHVGRRP